MADEDGTRSSDDKPTNEDTSKTSEARHAEIHMELRDSLPGGKAIIAVEQEGEFVWLASKQHVTEQAKDEFLDLLTCIAHERLWLQNWPGR